MHLKQFCLLAALALCGGPAFAQETPELDFAAECAGISAAVSASLAPPSGTDTDVIKELRQAAAEIHDNSYRRANDLGAQAGVPAVDVVKRMISAMVLSGQQASDQLRTAMRSRCERAFRRQP